MSRKSDDKVECRTPTPGKKPTRIERWKFEAIRDAVLRLVPRHGDGVSFMDLFRLVEDELAPDELKRVGSVPWHVTTVKLEMEVRGELRRVPGAKPQRLLLAD